MYYAPDEMNPFIGAIYIILMLCVLAWFVFMFVSVPWEVIKRVAKISKGKAVTPLRDITKLYREFWLKWTIRLYIPNIIIGVYFLIDAHLSNTYPVKYQIALNLSTLLAAPVQGLFAGYWFMLGHRSKLIKLNKDLINEEE